MKAFICVYQHSDPPRKDRDATASAAARDPTLQKFLASYDDPDNFYDWGDDPGFFAATHIMGDPLAASWGVCRRDVRAQLGAGDFIVWFCAKAELSVRQRLAYHFIGCSTVLDSIDRLRIWDDAAYRAYRRFYNVLARPESGRLRQHETFHEYHDDWEKRASAPYIVFDRDPRRSRLELKRPLLVARREPGDLSEHWLSAEQQDVSRLERLLFTDAAIDRRLRTGSLQRPHRQIALHSQPFYQGSVARLEDLRHGLIEFTARKRR